MKDVTVPVKKGRFLLPNLGMFRMNLCELPQGYTSEYPYEKKAPGGGGGVPRFNINNAPSKLVLILLFAEADLFPASYYMYQQSHF